MVPARVLANLFGITFVAVGLLGFLPNPIVAPDGIFAVNAAHNLVHVLTGVGFLAGAWFGHARTTLIGIGAAYVGVAILGFLTSGDALLGLIHINTADKWLHAGLAGAILASGLWLADEAAVTSKAAS